MSTLVLDSLEIKNFRAFKHLRIETLGRVNLIVGKNNVGKTSVLEALLLYVRQDKLEAIWEILGARDERVQLLGQDQPTIEDNVEALKYLFHGRQDMREQRSVIRIGAAGSRDDNLSIELTWYAQEGVLGGLGGSVGMKSLNTAPLRRLETDEVQSVKQAIPFLLVGLSNWPLNMYSLAPGDGRSVSIQNGTSTTPSAFISARGITKVQIGRLWDDITTTSLEADVISAMRLISTDVERLNLVAEKNSIYLQRNPVVKLRAAQNPIPLRSMGEGMNRMFGIALALVNAKDGMLLIDEVDTGLHYSVLPDLWKLIFEVAHRLNVQVFATSHSWDCIQAFQQAAEANKDEEGVLVRLENRKEGVGAVTFDESELAIVTREQIEVR